jgi:hypothetical protein
MGLPIREAVRSKALHGLRSMLCHESWMRINAVSSNASWLMEQRPPIDVCYATQKTVMSAE